MVDRVALESVWQFKTNHAEQVVIKYCGHGIVRYKNVGGNGWIECDLMYFQTLYEPVNSPEVM